MARGILAFFGGLSILVGCAILFLGLAASDRTSSPIPFALTLGSGCAFLIAGAPLLGFARVIRLLEQIAANTRPSAPVSVEIARQRIEPSLSEAAGSSVPIVPVARR